jgi:hypothetical protein
MKQNNGRLHNTTWMATGATRSLELHIEEFQSIFSFWTAGLNSRGNSKVEYTYDWYSASAVNKWYVKVMTRKIRHKVGSRNSPTLDPRFISSYISKLKL